MGELTLVYGPAHPEKWTPTLERCRQILAGGQRILWLCPTPFQAASSSGACGAAVRNQVV